MSRPFDQHVALPVEAEVSGSETPVPEQARGAAADERAAANGTATIARLADDLLPLLISRLGASSLGELEVRQDGWRVRLRRQPTTNDEPAAVRTRPGRAAERSVGRTSERGAEAASPAGRAPGVTRGDRLAGTDRTVITSPAVGYYQPREGVTVGSSLRAGDLLGHVDVLGVLQDVVVPVDGRLARLLAEPGEAVEYGQPLARLEPESRA